MKNNGCLFMIHSLLTNSFLASTSIRCRQGLQQKFDVMQQAVVEINGISEFRSELIAIEYIYIYTYI